MSKTKTLSTLQGIVSRLKKHGKRIVFTNGCFDLLHPGHIKILKTAKEKGDILIVGLNADTSIKRLKGNARPIIDEKARICLLEAIEYVDYIVLFEEDTPLHLIKALRPYCLVKGEDWHNHNVVGQEFVKKVCFVKFYPGYSTTKIIEKIKHV